MTAAFFGVSEAVFNSVMSDLQHFVVSADFLYGTEAVAIDNVSFFEPAVEGEETGENMSVGYDDAAGAHDGGGDQITEGDDTIIGGGGFDTINAGAGSDVIYGGGQATLNLITNGDFSGVEANNNPSGWTVSESSSVQVQVQGGGTNFSGAGTPAGGSISQSVTGAPVGEPITVAFDFIEIGNDRDAAIRVQVTDGDGLVVLDHTVNGTGSYSFDFTSTRSNYTIQFTDASTGDISSTDARIDNVEFLVSEPEDDVIDAQDGDDMVFGGLGNDSITGSAGRDSLVGGDGDDTLDGGSQIDTLEGGDGDDLIDGGYSTDQMDGGAGNDTVSYEGAFGGTEYVDLDLEAGTGELRSADGTLLDTESVTNLENAIGGSGDDIISGTTGENRIEGGDGNDSITGGDGRETLIGGAGDDTINTITGSVSGLESGGESTANDDTVDAGAGDDTIIGGLGRDTIFGGSGRDSIDGGNAADDIDGGSGDDTIDGGFGSNTLKGGDDADLFHVGIGDDTVLGGEGGNDQDTLSIDQADDAINIVFTEDEAGTFADDDGDTGEFSEIEAFELSAGADTVDGSAATTQSITVDAGSGNDKFVIADGSGNDVITDFDLNDDDGNGFTNDELDVTGLTNADGNPITALDVVVTDDGSGNAVLNFPNGETVTLQGVAPSQVDSAPELYAMGIPCFATGTLIRTPQGEIPVEELRANDLVLTLDCGPQPILWVGCRSPGPTDLAPHPNLRPVLIPKGVLGNHAPLMVSPQHCMLLGLDQGCPVPAFARAKHLAEARGPIRIAHGRRNVSYHHILLSRHHILFANGAPSESFYPGQEALRHLTATDWAGLFQMMPSLAGLPVDQVYGPRARPVLRRKDTLRVFGRSVAVCRRVREAALC